VDQTRENLSINRIRGPDRKQQVTPKKMPRTEEHGFPDLNCLPNPQFNN
jgi:hypothetical protein